MAARGIAYRTPDADNFIAIDQLSRRDSRWVQRAIGVAYTSDHPRQQLGAVAVRGGKIIGWSVNRFRNHPRVVPNWYECSVHAEQGLVERFAVAGASVYIARVSPSRVAVAKPCQECMRRLIGAGVRRIVWTESDEYVGIMGLG